jgi:hypothetical protein
MTNYERLFGTPEKVAGRLAKLMGLMKDDICDRFDNCRDCPLYDAAIPHRCWNECDEGTVLEWLKEES